MRAALPLLLLLPACGLEPALGPAAVVGGGSLILTGRTPVDHVVSWARDADCSVVRLERREPYCAQPTPSAPVPFCTRSLGTVDCWAAPGVVPGRGVADPGR